MKGSSIIQKPLALLALLLFLFSATPKKFLHDLLADHQDFYGAVPGEDPGISNTGFDCHIHDLVVSTPFIAANFSSPSPFAPQFAVHATTGTESHLRSTTITEDYRGPPSAVNS